MRMRGIVAVGAALLVLGACSGDPQLYLGGPPGPVASLDLSTHNTTVVVGDSIAFGANALDAVGNVTGVAPTVTSCGTGVATVAGSTGGTTFSTSVFIRGSALGVGCLLVSAGGVSDSVVITSGPAGVVITGPDTVGSGNPAAYGLTAVDVAGNALTGTTAYNWSASNAARLAVNPATGDVAGKATGTVAVRVRAPGGANAFKNVVVAPGVFGGALSQTTGAPGDILVVTRAADGEFFDDDTQVSLGGVAMSVDRVVRDTLYVGMFATGATTAQTLSFSNLGSAQVAQTTSYTSNNADTDKYAATARATLQAPATSPTLANILSPGGSIFLAVGGLGTGSAARSAVEGTAAGTQNSMFFKVVAGGSDLDLGLTLTWTDGSDMDILICDGGVIDPATLANCDDAGFSGSTSTEVLNTTIAAGTTRYVIIATWTAGSNRTNLKLAVTGL